MDPVKAAAAAGAAVLKALVSEAVLEWALLLALNEADGVWPGLAAAPLAAAAGPSKELRPATKLVKSNFENRPSEAVELLREWCGPAAPG